jgi:hypothetical protein
MVIAVKTAITAIEEIGEAAHDKRKNSNENTDEQNDCLSSREHGEGV